MQGSINLSSEEVRTILMKWASMMSPQHIVCRMETSKDLSVVIDFEADAHGVSMDVLK